MFSPKSMSNLGRLTVLTEENINEENVDEDIEEVEELDQVQPHRPVVVAVQVVPQIPTHHFANPCNLRISLTEHCF